MFDDFLGFTLADGAPPTPAGRLDCGIGWRWLGAGVLELTPDSDSAPAALPAILLSAGVHGDETAPIEMLSRLIRDLATGATPLRVRLLAVFGNVAAMRRGERFVDFDLNRLFVDAPAAQVDSLEGRRAARLREWTADFFAAAGGPRGPRFHYDMHTAIRASLIERFAILPYRAGAAADDDRTRFDWLAAAGIDAAVAHRAPSSTFSALTAQLHAARSCTLELGQARPFGQNDPRRYAAVDAALRATAAGRPPRPAPGAAVRRFEVVAELEKRTDAFELLIPDDAPNFTACAAGTIVARDAGYVYTVAHPEERIVFPNRRVKNGLRAGLMLVEIPAYRADSE